MGDINQSRNQIDPVDLTDQHELDKLNLKLWDKIDGKMPEDVSELDILLLISALVSSDFDIRAAAISQLNRFGQFAVKHLVSILVKNPTDSTLLFKVTYALEEIGKRAVPSLLEALKHVEFKSPVDLTLLENITETLIRLNDKSAVPVLIGYIKQVNAELSKLQPSSGSAKEAIDSHQRKMDEFYNTVRLRIHDLLGDMNSAEGLDDLLILLGDGKKRVHVDVIETIRKVGDKRALIPLVNLYPTELNISELGARYIKLTFREIVRREKISRNHAIFQNISHEEKDVLERLFPGKK
jgi:HEAT repeat protein